MRRKFASIVQPDDVSETLRITSNSQAKFNKEQELIKIRLNSEERAKTKQRERMDKIFARINQTAQEQNSLA